MFIGQFLEGNKMGLYKIQNGGYFAHAQVLNAYNNYILFQLNSIILTRIFIGQFLEGNKMAP